MIRRTRSIGIGFVLLGIGMAIGLWEGARASEKGEQARRVRSAPDSSASRGESSERSSQNPVPSSSEVISLRSDLVLVTVTVMGAQGELGPEDFEVLEDGVPQRIVFFSGEAALPLRLVVLFDTSLSVKDRLEFQKQAVARFFRLVMRPRDQAALISVSTEAVLRQEFTEDVSRLIGAIRGLRAEGATALYDALVMGAEYVGTVQGRRILVVLSDGRDTISRVPLVQAVRRLQEVGATVYAITLRESSSASAWEVIGETTLQTLAQHTGGEVFSPVRLEELDPVFARVAEQLRMQYVLGFYSTNEARDGTFRRLTVRVKRAGVIARAREGYYAPKP